MAMFEHWNLKGGIWHALSMVFQRLVRCKVRSSINIILVVEIMNLVSVHANTEITDTISPPFGCNCDTKLCNNFGMQTQDVILVKAFVCKPCTQGTYFLVAPGSTNANSVSNYQSIKGFPRKQWKIRCGGREWSGDSMPSPEEQALYFFDCLFSVSFLEDIPGSEPKLQSCQHCPFYTIVNSLKEPTRYDAFKIKEQRCFVSCYEAWTTGNKLETNLYTSVLNGGNVEYNNVNLFREIEGARDYQKPPLEIYQSAISFSNPDIKKWLESDEAQMYRRYISNNYRNKEIILLPPPQRYCFQCPIGKSLLRFNTFVNGNFNSEHLDVVKDSFNTFKTFMTGNVHVATDFFYEISWLKIESLYSFQYMEVCVSCPPGTYFNRNSLNLAQGVGNGDSRASIIDRENSMGNDVVYLKNWSLYQLRCHPCEAGTYRDVSNSEVWECKICSDDKFPVLVPTQLKIQMTPNTIHALRWTYLATECSLCPAGYERSGNTKCAAIALTHGEGNYNVIHKNDCCNPCNVNFYKASGRAACTNVDSNKATEVPYGNTKQLTCNLGTELRACKEVKREPNEAVLDPQVQDFCRPTEDMRDEDWRVCLACTGVERPVMIFSEPRCIMCNAEMDEGEALGEFYNTLTNECKSCDGCSVFEPAVRWRSFFDEDSNYKQKMSGWLNLESRENSFRILNRWHYKHFNITEACKPLGRRRLVWNELTKNITIAGEDRRKVPTSKKWTGQLYMDGPLPAFHAIDFELFEAGAKRCKVQRCEMFCPARYHYSQGCGAGAAQQDLWVRRATSAASGGTSVWSQMRLETLGASLRASGAAAAEFAGWELKHHGNCVECKICDNGKYNPTCNVFAENTDPAGVCNDCKTSCGGDMFLWHKEGLRGCTPLAASRRGRVLSDYECKSCPTWIRRAGNMYTVLGCGFKENFGWWRMVTLQVQEQTLQKNEVLAMQAYEHPDVQVAFKPFHALGTYCPDGHFFDATITGCSFKPETVFGLHNDDMTFGYEPYRLQCCRLCETCDSDRYRMTAKYKECTGEQTEDTQSSACGDRCESGFYVKDEAQLECVACTEC